MGKKNKRKYFLTILAFCVVMAMVLPLIVLAYSSDDSPFWIESGWNGDYSFTVNTSCEAVYTYSVIGPMPNYFAYRLFTNTGELIFEMIVWDFYHTAGIIRPSVPAGLYKVQVYSVNGSWTVTAACENGTGIENE